MLIQINTCIIVMVLDSIWVQNFHYLMVVWVEMSLFLELKWARYWIDIDNKGKDILVLGKCPTQGLDSITLTAEAQYSINFSRSNRNFCLSLHYNLSNSFLICYCYKNISIPSKRFWNKKYLLWNISENFSSNHMKKNKNKTELNGCVCYLFVIQSIFNFKILK